MKRCELSSGSYSSCSSGNSNYSYDSYDDADDGSYSYDDESSNDDEGEANLAQAKKELYPGSIYIDSLNFKVSLTN